MSPEDRIFVAGHRGMVGSAVCRRLEAEGFTRIVTRTRAELDLTDPGAVRDFFGSEPIDRVVLAAARVGGIHANDTRPADFIHQNLMIEANVIHRAFTAGVKQLLFLGSSCIYPRLAPQPMSEEHLLTGPLEPTNEPYAVAKIAGIKLCESYNRQHGTDFRSVMPTNLYGPEDTYDLLDSHVLPAMIRKFHLARLALENNRDAIEADAAVHGPIPPDLLQTLRSNPPAVVLWGTGTPRREFLHVDDLASACLFIMKLPASEYRARTRPMRSHINVGTGEDVAIRELAEMVRRAVGFEGEVVWDRSKPDGAPRKLLDVSLLTQMGWRARIPLPEGIRRTYHGYAAALS